MAFKSAIVFKQIKSDAHLRKFSRLTQKYIDVHYPIEYLKRSRVVAIVTEDDNGKIQAFLGGYIVATKGPFRVLEQIPRETVKMHFELQQNIDKCFELTGLWIHPLLKSGTFRARFWLKLFGDLVLLTARGKTQALYSYDASKTKLGEIYSISKPKRIFEGPVFIAGMTEEAIEIVEMGSIPEVVKAFYREPSSVAKFLGRRIFRKRLEFQKQEAEASAT